MVVANSGLSESAGASGHAGLGHGFINNNRPSNNNNSVGNNNIDNSHHSIADEISATSGDNPTSNSNFGAD